MKSWHGLSKNDCLIMVVCAICLMVCAYLFTHEEVFQSEIFGGAKALGKIIQQVHDTRHKDSQSLVWNKTREDQEIRLGDGLFAGKDSFAIVELNRGGALTVSENSMVFFHEVASKRVADLQNGNFKIKVNGTVKIAVKGELTTLKGKNSEVQVTMEKGQPPTMKLLEGHAEVKTNDQTTELTETEPVAEIEIPAEEVEVLPPPPPPEVPRELKTPGAQSYYVKLGDLYESHGEELLEKPMLSEVELPVTLDWTTRNNDRATVELSHVSEFKEALRIDAPKGSPATVSRLFVGENYWRVSLDQSNWSKLESFNVEAKVLDGRPGVGLPESEIPFIGGQAEGLVVLSSETPAGSYVVEASSSEKFKPGESHIYLSNSSKIQVKFAKPGKYFYRFRFVTFKQELSAWSETKSFHVFNPDLPDPPRLVRATNSGFVTDTFSFKYRSRADKNEVLVLNDKGLEVFKSNVLSFDWAPKEPGLYKAVARSFNRFNQPGEKTAETPIEVKLQPQPKPQLQLQPKLELAEKVVPTEEVARKPSATESELRLKTNDNAESIYVNEKYKSSMVSVDGFVWEMYSTQQTIAGTAAPQAAGVSVDGLHWWDHSGLEGLARTEAFGINQEGGFTDLEARYHYRFYLPIPFWLFRELQVSVFGGLENYTSNVAYFASHYDLLTFGTSLEFPFADRWTGGGEFVYGRGLDQSEKYEITGHLRYFLDRSWSLGAGYKVHYFQAGSSSVEPLGYLPYREGYIELFSGLDFHF